MQTLGTSMRHLNVANAAIHSGGLGLNHEDTSEVISPLKPALQTTSWA